MISASRASVCSKVQESRRAFCCISSAEVATPPALAALPGAKSTPASSEDRARRRASSACWRPRRPTRQPLLHQRAGAAASSSSFCGRARQRHVARDVPDGCRPATYGAAGAPVGVVADPRALDLLELLEQVEVDAAPRRRRSRRSRSTPRPSPPSCVDLLDRRRWPRCPSRRPRTLAVEGRRRAGAASPARRRRCRSRWPPCAPATPPHADALAGQHARTRSGW